MLIHTAVKLKFSRTAAIALLAGCAWFAASAASTQQTADATVQYNVMVAVKQDSNLQDQKISAAADEGIVTLTGTVQTQSQRQQAETDASKVPGVSGIINHLEVENSGSAAPDAGLAAQASANQLSPDNEENQDQAQSQQQNESTVPPPPPDETQPQQPEQPQEPYGAAPPPPPGYGAPPQQAYEPPRQVPYYNTPTQPVIVPPGTLLRVRLDQPLDTAHLQSGAVFQATNAVDVFEHGILAIPRGAALTGQVVEAKEGGKLGGSAILRLQLTSVNLAGTVFPLATDVWSSRGPNKAGYTASNTAGGAILGALIGGLVGRGAGAAVGAGVGAVGGLAASSATNGPRVYLPVEAQVDFHLTTAATVQPVSWREAQRLASSVPPPAVLVRRPPRPVYVVPRPYYAPYPYPY